MPCINCISRYRSQLKKKPEFLDRGPCLRSKRNRGGGGEGEARKNQFFSLPLPLPDNACYRGLRQDAQNVCIYAKYMQSTLALWTARRCGHPDKTESSPHVKESGIQNPAFFCLWNPESEALESGIRLLESGIHGNGIRKPGLLWNPGFTEKYFKNMKNSLKILEIYALLSF